MSQYSELMGSFLRTGNFPLEANYIFATEEALKEFYSDPINATTLHKGLLRVVENGGDGQQALYWVVKKQTNDELEFVKLIQNIDIDNIDTQLTDLLNKLNQEIQDRKDADIAIWGTSDSTNVPDDLNSIMDLASAVSTLRQDISDLQDSDNTINEQIRALAGTEQTDIVEYLKTLPYQSLTEVSNALNKFLNEVDSSTTKINTLVELQNFLDGYTDSDTLRNVLYNLWNKIEGDVTPSEEFQTLKGIEEFVRTLEQWARDRTNNLQTELDQTQVGVGLSGDGSFSPDKETNYLQDATSIMNALKILDGLVFEAISGITITPENNDVVQLAVRKELEGYVIAAKLLLSNAYGNELLKKDDGLYINVVSEYDSGTLTLKVNDKIVSQHVLGFSSLVSKAYYDNESESIKIVFRLLSGDNEEITIPVGALIREWEPDNSNPDRVVEIYRETVIDGADKVSADVRIAQDTNNILEKRGNTLFVNGTSERITHNGQSLSTVINDIKDASSQIRQDLTNEIDRAKATEQTISHDLEDEVSRATQSEISIQNDLNNHKTNTNNPHKVTKEQVGLSNVDNTSDLNKPVSNATKEYITEQGFARVSDIPEGLEIGETTGTAFDGGRGKAVEDKISNLPYLVIGYNSFTENKNLPNFHSEIVNNPDKENTLKISVLYKAISRTTTFYDNFLLPSATTTAAGVMSVADKQKLDSIPTLTTSGDGTKYLSDNGTYKTIEIPDLSNYLTENDKTELETEIGDLSENVNAQVTALQKKDSTIEGNVTNLTETVNTINDTVSGLDDKYLPLSGGTLDGSIYFDSALSTEENPIHELIINRSGGTQYITVGSLGRIEIENGDIGTISDFITCTDTGDFLKKDPENPGISYRAVMTTTNPYAGNQMNVNYISQVTQSVYDGLSTKDANTLYIITE